MRRFWLLFGLFLFALLAGCGQQSGPGGENGASLSATQALETYAAVQSRFVVPLTQIAPGAGGLVPPFILYLSAFDPYAHELPLGDCHVDASGSLADADHDLVPKDATFNGSCSWSITLDVVNVTVTWGFDDFKIQDPDDNNPNAGYRASGGMSWELQAGPGSEYTLELSVTRHELVWKADQSLYTYEYTGAFTWRDEDDAEHRDAYHLTGTWKPEDTDDPWFYGWQTIDEGSKIEDQEPGGSGWVTEHELDLQTNAALHFTEQGIESGELEATFIDYGTTPPQSCNLTITWSDYRAEFGGSCLGSGG